jgi:hypothetical protein
MKLSAAIVCFCSADQGRRGSLRLITSMVRVRALVRVRVRGLSATVRFSAADMSCSMRPTNHKSGAGR